jgi:hypothetical protein
MPSSLAVGLIRIGVAAVWLVHGLYNKLLGGSPRHLAIVQSVPGLSGDTGALALAAIGTLEVLIAAWVLSGWRPRRCAAVQAAALLSMNVVELTFARPLLLSPAGLLPLNAAFLAAAWIAADPGLTGRLRARLRRHPLPIDAHFRDCLTLTYALPEAVLRPLLPPGLELETAGGHGFVAVALVRAERLRPAGVPAALGCDFFLAGYRVFTRFRAPDGRERRGLRILRSDADSGVMVAGGNLLTHYNYAACRAAVNATPGRIHVTVASADRGGDLDLEADLTDGSLPPGSPFASVRDARRFAGPLPYTFDYEAETHSIVAIEGRRTNWRPSPVGVRVGRISFFDRPAFAGCTPVLAAAFHVSGIDYRWRRGVRYPLGGRPMEVSA